LAAKDVRSASGSGVAHLNGKTVLITGGAGGIGSATARRFAELGAVVVAADVLDEDGEALAAGLGEPHSYVHLDVTDYHAWERTLSLVVDRYGGLDILFLIAGVMLRDRGVANNDDPFLWLTKERTDRVVGVNLTGVLNGFLAALPHLEARGGGHVILLGQLSVLGPDPIYTATKQALVGFTRSIGPSAAKRGITVVGVRTSIVDTPLISTNVRESGVPLNSASRVADDLITIVANARSGEFWVIGPADDDDPPSRFEFPPLPEKLTRGIDRTNAMFTEAVGVPSIRN
jgi:NAD(P)-dependent dehydrogenase (short-subunit alcohol dehydrogenase family)